MKIQMFIPVSPYGKQRPQATVRGDTIRMYTPEQTVNSEAEIRFYVRQELKKFPAFAIFDGAVAIALTAQILRPKAAATRIYPIGKPDSDNILKLASDALNGVVWIDDCQIVSTRLDKCYARTPEEVGYLFSAWQLNTREENENKRRKRKLSEEFM